MLNSRRDLDLERSPQVHYRVKHALAKLRAFDFVWRQGWESAPQVTHGEFVPG